MLTVAFIDHSEEIAAKIQRKIAAAAFAAADQLADGYKTELQRTIAPPHSRPGEIPHAYHGWLPGGFGPTNPNFDVDDRESWFNNRAPDFDSVQSSYLSNFIESGSSDDGAVVGFRPSHVGSRKQNYLIAHDQGTVPQGVRRPWILPIFDQEKAEMAARAKSAFERTG